MTPSQPPDHTMGMPAIFSGSAPVQALHQKAAIGLVGQGAAEIIDAAIAFGLADDSDDLVGGKAALLQRRTSSPEVSWGLESSNLATSTAMGVIATSF